MNYGESMNDLFVPLTDAVGYRDWKEVIEEAFKPRQILVLEGHYNMYRLGYQIDKLVLAPLPSKL